MRATSNRWRTLGLASLVAALGFGLFWFGPIPAEWLAAAGLEPGPADPSALAAVDVDLVAALTVHGNWPVLETPGWLVFGRMAGAGVGMSGGAADGVASRGPLAGSIGVRFGLEEHRPAADGAAARASLRQARLHGGGVADRSPSGELHNDAIRRTLGRKRGSLEACYWSARTHDPTLVGDATFLVTVKEAGDVSVEVGETSRRLAEAGVTDCIRSKLEALSFRETPPRGGDVNLRLPMSFLEP
jgi:hypothetical protein